MAFSSASFASSFRRLTSSTLVFSNSTNIRILSSSCLASFSRISSTSCNAIFASLSMRRTSAGDNGESVSTRLSALIVDLTISSSAFSCACRSNLSASSAAFLAASSALSIVNCLALACSTTAFSASLFSCVVTSSASLIISAVRAAASFASLDASSVRALVVWPSSIASTIRGDSCTPRLFFAECSFAARSFSVSRTRAFSAASAFCLFFSSSSESNSTSFAQRFPTEFSS